MRCVLNSVSVPFALVRRRPLWWFLLRGLQVPFCSVESESANKWYQYHINDINNGLNTFKPPLKTKVTWCLRSRHSGSVPLKKLILEACSPTRFVPPNHHHTKLTRCKTSPATQNTPLYVLAFIHYDMICQAWRAKHAFRSMLSPLRHTHAPTHANTHNRMRCSATSAIAKPLASRRLCWILQASDYWGWISLTWHFHSPSEPV